VLEEIRASLMNEVVGIAMVHWLAHFPSVHGRYDGGDTSAAKSCAYCPHTAQYHTAMGSSIASALFIMYHEEMQEAESTCRWGRGIARRCTLTDGIDG
jgi:hypothetical protein